MTAITAGVGASRTVSSAGGGRTYAFNNLSTSPTQILGQNPQRQKLTVHNPGTIDAYIAPMTVVNSGSDVLLLPSPSALGGCYIVYANGGTTVIDGECQKAWQAFSASGSNNPLTVVDCNV